MRLANLKVGARHREVGDLFTRFFPDRLRVGQQQFHTLNYLIEHTRHTPRDFVQLLKALQKFAPPGGPLTSDGVLSGIRRYCVDYFVPEIKDELTGPLTPGDVDLLFGLLGSLRRRKFDMDTIEAVADGDGRYRGLDTARALGLLFEASAIGNQQTRYAGAPYYTFKYRNRHSQLDLTRRMIMHRALGKAMNLLDN